MSTRIKNRISGINLSYLIAVLGISFISALYPQDLSGIKIGIVYSAVTKNILHNDDNNFYPIQDWELFFLNKKISYEVFDDEGLDDYDFDEMDILILPSVEILSDDGLENLQEFLKDGKGLFILGKLGVKNDDENNRQIDGLQDLAGIQVNEFLELNLIAKKHILYANNFLTHNMQNNSNLIVMNNLPLLYTENPQWKFMNLGEYANSYEENIGSKSGIVKVEREKGRLLWFGFQLSQISVENDKTDLLEKIIYNSIEWLAGNPIAWVNKWYLNLKCAAVVTSMIENPVELGNDLLIPFAYSSQVSNNNFFITPQAVISFPVEVERLASYGDIYILYDELGYLNLAENEKFSMLENAAKTLRNKTKQTLFGIKYINSNEKINIAEKPGSNLFDFFIGEDNSIIVNDKKNGLAFNNYRMIVPAINYPSKLNNFYISNELDDYKNQFDYVQNIGGIFPVVYVNQFSTLKGSLELKTFRKTLSYLRKYYAWITTYSALVKWLIEKENIFVKIEELGEKTVLRVIIENRNKENVNNLGIRLVLSSEYQNPSVVNRNFRLRYDALTRSYDLIVPYLLANQYTIVEVYYDN